MVCSYIDGVSVSEILAVIPSCFSFTISYWLKYNNGMTMHMMDSLNAASLVPNHFYVKVGKATLACSCSCFSPHTCKSVKFVRHLLIWKIFHKHFF